MILYFRNIRANNNLWFPHKIHKENFASQFFLNSDSINALLCMPQNFANFADPYRGANWNYLCSMYRNFTLLTYIVKVFAKTPNPMWSFKSKTSLHQQSLSILLVVLAFSKSKTELSLTPLVSYSRQNNFSWK